MASTPWNERGRSSEGTAKESPSLRKAGPYSMGRPAKVYYEHLAKRRGGVVQEARDMAQLTIPSVFPPEGYIEGDNLNANEQSVGALCVSTLSSKLMFMALPPDRPVLRFKAIEQRLKDEIAQDPSLWTKIEVALSKKELEHRSRMETTGIRAAYVGAVRQLTVAGNVCWEHLDLNNPCYHRMDSYVVKRNKKGEPLFTIVLKPTDFEDLDEDVQDLVKRNKPDLFKDKPEYEVTVDIYAVCKRIPDESDPHGYAWEYWEEYEGEKIDGTEVTTDYVSPPLYPAWMIPMFGSNWGRSYCAEYRGDIIAIENHAAAIADGASAAALMLLFLNPGSRTSIKQVKGAANFSVFPGKADDLTMFKSEKLQDMQFLIKNMETLSQRLGRAFLLVSSVQRQGERVTAEEINRMAREVDESMGGTYSVVAQGFQRVVVTRFVALHEDEDHLLPALDPKLFRTEVITGIEAMGRSFETEALVTATATAVELTKGGNWQYTDMRDWLQRVYMGHGVNTDGLVRTQEQQAAEEDKMRKQQMQATLLEKGTAPAVAAIGKTGGDMAAAMAPGQDLSGGADAATPPGTEPQEAPQQ